MIQKVTTLNQFIIEQQAAFPNATGDFSRLLHHVGIAAKKVNREVNKAGLVDILGQAGTENVQGEDQQKLDVYADPKKIRILLFLKTGCAGMQNTYSVWIRWMVPPI